MKNETQKLIEHGYLPKPYHRAKLISQNGDVSPLCAKTPRKINLAKELWTIRDEAVTCPKCIKIINSKKNTLDREVNPRNQS